MNTVEAIAALVIVEAVVSAASFAVFYYLFIKE